jgi:hypothetical protein
MSESGDPVNPECSSPDVAITDAKAPFNNPDAEVIIRSSDHVDFRVFKAFLSSVSGVFKDMFAIPQGPGDIITADEEMRDGLPVIPITEESQVVETLLMFCYPNILTSAPVLKTMEEILPILKVAIKYGIEALETQMRNALFTPPVVAERSMQVFVTAYLHRWEKEMRIAAKYTLVQPSWDCLYVTELESITGGDLHRLQNYRLGCAAAAKRTATTLGWIKREHIDGLHCSGCEEPTHQIELGWMRYKLGGWWVNYMRNAAKELADKPRGDTVLASKLIDAAMQQANRCQRCRDRTETKVRFRDFCEVFAAHVDRAISEVSRDA